MCLPEAANGAICMLFAFILALLCYFKRKVSSDSRIRLISYYCFLFSLGINSEQLQSLWAFQIIMHAIDSSCKRDGQTRVSRVVYIFTMNTVSSYIDLYDILRL